MPYSLTSVEDWRDLQEIDKEGKGIYIVLQSPTVSFSSAFTEYLLLSIFPKDSNMR